MILPQKYSCSRFFAPLSLSAVGKTMFRVYVESPDGIPRVIPPSHCYDQSPCSMPTFQSAESKSPITPWQPPERTNRPPFQSEHVKGFEVLPLQSNNRLDMATRLSVSGKMKKEITTLCSLHASRRPKSMWMRCDMRSKHTGPVFEGGKPIHSVNDRVKVRGAPLRVQASAGNTSAILSPSKYKKFLDFDAIANYNTRNPQRVESYKLPTSIPSYLDRTIARTRDAKVTLLSFSDGATSASRSPTYDIASLPKASCRPSRVSQATKITGQSAETGTLSRRRIKLKAETVTC